MVRLTVIDLLGKEVATIVNEELSPGDYLRTWNASNVPSGVYYYRMTAGSFVQTRKMLLTK
ncbi:MAG: T9SS type A sorting domain-containing protein [Ignavibacteria bacterium]|nr:T9SS type A sorting domain-containing protein [Ignavibacteria bacterium]